MLTFTRKRECFSHSVLIILGQVQLDRIISGVSSCPYHLVGPCLCVVCMRTCAPAQMLFVFVQIIRRELGATAGVTPGPRCFCQAHFE